MRIATEFCKYLQKLNECYRTGNSGSRVAAGSKAYGLRLVQGRSEWTVSNVLSDQQLRVGQSHASAQSSPRACGPVRRACQKYCGFHLDGGFAGRCPTNYFPHSPCLRRYQTRTSDERFLTFARSLYQSPFSATKHR